METIRVQGTAKRRAPGNGLQALIGVNASGNLEVLVERTLPDNECLVEVTTAVVGFEKIWQAVSRSSSSLRRRAFSASRATVLEVLLLDS
jgi:hypothetical protein